MPPARERGSKKKSPIAKSIQLFMQNNIFIDLTSGNMPIMVSWEGRTDGRKDGKFYMYKNARFFQALPTKIHNFYHWKWFISPNSTTENPNFDMAYQKIPEGKNRFSWVFGYFSYRTLRTPKKKFSNFYLKHQM